MYRARHIVGSLALALACISVGEPSLAQTVSHNESVVGLAVQAEGRPIAQVDVVLSRSSGNTSRDEAIVARLKNLLAPMQGQAFSRALVESSLGGARSRIGAGQIGYRVLDAPTVGSVVLRIEVDTSLDAAGAEANRLMFPNLYRDDRSYLTAMTALTSPRSSVAASVCIRMATHGSDARICLPKVTPLQATCPADVRVGARATSRRGSVVRRSSVTMHGMPSAH